MHEKVLKIHLPKQQVSPQLDNKRGWTHGQADTQLQSLLYHQLQQVMT